MSRLTGLLLLSLFTAPAQATEYTLLLGGGASPKSSEVSIESNVAWISAILDTQYSVQAPIMFAAGSKGEVADVRFTARQTPADVNTLTLARIFDDRKYYLDGFRRNAVATLPQAATRDNAIKLLQNSLADMTAGDSLLFIYNGHGGRTPATRKAHHLRLWERSRLTVEDMVTVFNKQPADTNLRLVLPQCFSGPFVKIIHQDLDTISGGNINTSRCAFIAAPAHRESEGCTPYEDESNYVDYSTYFFAALQGRSRIGQPLPVDPDRNGDGVTDLSEAHYYTVLHGFSKDVPRTTSEYFLEWWQPWYLRWQSFIQPTISADNSYESLAMQLSEVLGYSPKEQRRKVLKNVSDERARLEDTVDKLKAELKSQRKQERQRQAALRQLTIQQWPELGDISREDYKAMPDQEMARVAAWLDEQPDFLHLTGLQEAMDATENRLLDLDRELGMHLRVIRFFELSRLFELLYRFGSAEDITRFEELQACERWAPSSSTGEAQ